MFIFPLRYDAKTDLMFCCPPVFQSVAYSGKWDFSPTCSTNYVKNPHDKLDSDDYYLYTRTFTFTCKFIQRQENAIFLIQEID